MTLCFFTFWEGQMVWKSWINWLLYDKALLYLVFGCWLPVDAMKQTKVANVDKIEEEKEGEEGQGEKTEGEEKEVAGNC